MKFDSKFEESLFLLLNGCAYHPDDRIAYYIPKMYEPDFLFVEDSKAIYIEAKGRFRTSEEARKYIEIRNALGKNEEIVFIFQNPKTPMPFAKRRKDGTRYNMEEWAIKNNFRYFTSDTVPEEWNETTSCNP